MPIFKLDLNNPGEFTVDGVRKLIASVDDSVDRQLRVTRDGYAVITGHDGPEEMEGYVLRTETWDAGNGNSGLLASQEASRIENIYRELKRNWPNPKISVLDL